jgi:hypothetical protein
MTQEEMARVREILGKVKPLAVSCYRLIGKRSPARYGIEQTGKRGEAMEGRVYMVGVG